MPPSASLSWKAEIVYRSLYAVLAFAAALLCLCSRNLFLVASCWVLGCCGCCGDYAADEAMQYCKLAEQQSQQERSDEGYGA